MELYIDLEKALNRGKLVQKRTMVRGKDGKIYYRMQWVDPSTGLPADAHTIQTTATDNKEASKKHHDTSTQKGFIDHHIDKNMSREEKYKHLEKHGVTWKPNDHEAIDHKNAMVALKDHLYKNPHLVGAEHLPKDADPMKTTEGGHSVDDFANAYKKHPELLYDMMKHLGVVDKSQVDPRTIEGQQHTSKGGNGKGDIMHMRNMMGFKKLLKEKPHLMDEMKNHDKFGAVHGSKPKVAEPTAPTPKAKVADKPQSTAQKGGNTIKGVLDAMSREDKYKLIKHLGIAGGDPALDPTIEEKMRPIHNMRHMMALKKAIEADPSILNLNHDTGGLSDDEKARVAGLSGKEKTASEVKDFLDRASTKLKAQWADDYADHKHMKSRIKSDHDNIDNMHKTNALRKILTDDPSIMDELKGELEHEELLNLKIGNKDMGKFLRQIAGLKGIGDVVAGFDRGKQWEFGVDSTAEITEDDEGEPILSILDAGKDGEDYNEIAFPLKKVKEFLDGLKGGTAVEVKAKDIPLHKKAPTEIWRELNRDFEGNYNSDVGERLKPEIGGLWDAERTNNVHDFLKNSPTHIEKSTFLKLLKDYGVHTTTDGTRFASGKEPWKKVVYTHKIEQSKSKNATDYLEKNMDGSNDTWVLHESAKHWTPDQRMEARKDFISGNLKIDGLKTYADGEDRKVKIIDHLHKTLEHVPFDLMTDVFAHGCTLNFAKKYDGKDHIGNFHNGTEGGIWFDHGYIDDLHSLNSGHPMSHKPAGRDYPSSRLPAGHSGPIPKYGFHPFSDTCAHEFAHAIDGYLSGGYGSYVSWDTTDSGKKYAGKHVTVVGDSYDKAVNSSNPRRYVGKSGNASQPYYYHQDEFMSHYEGRIYAGGSNLVRDGSGSYKDSTYSSHDKGVEHWSENVSRTANAVMMYKQWQEQTGNTSVGMDSWAGMMHQSFMQKGYGDESNEGKDMGNGNYLKSYMKNGGSARNANPQEAYGYLYHTLTKKHPDLHQGIRDILLRPDFVGDKSVSGVIDRAEQGDHVRKSVELIINI